MSSLDEGPKQTDVPPGNQHCWAARWGPTVGWMSVIFVASAWPGHGPPSTRGTDKLLHLVAYAVLTVLLFRCWWATGRRPRLVASTCYAAIIAIVYGLLLELYQLRVPGRECQLSDILANCAGVVIAALIMLYLGSLSAKKRRTNNVDEEQ